MEDHGVLIREPLLGLQGVHVTTPNTPSGQKELDLTVTGGSNSINDLLAYVLRERSTTSILDRKSVV